jgi:hypothetical protein
MDESRREPSSAVAKKNEIAFSFFVPMVVAWMPDPSDQSSVMGKRVRDCVASRDT